MTAENHNLPEATDSLGKNETAVSQEFAVDAAPLSLKDMLVGLRTVLDQTGAYIYMKDLAGRYTYANQNVQDLFGVSLENIIGRDDSHFFDLEHANQLRVHDRRVIDFGEKVEGEERNIIKPFGEMRIYWSIKKPVHNDLGQIIGLCGISTDITERKQAEQFERFRNYILELISGGTALPSLLNNIVTGVEALNPEMLCSILLLDSEGKHLLQGAAPSLPDFYNSAIDGVEIGDGVGSCGTAAFSRERVIVNDIATHPHWAPYKDLAARAGLGSCWSQPILSSTGQVLGTFAIYHHNANTPTQYALSIIEQTARLASIAIERKQIEDKVHRLAFYDSLTKLANRILLIDRLSQAMAASQRSRRYGALMFLDMDNFKSLNDAHGHAAGDLLLIEVANRLKNCIREIDTASRFGGDEFVVMITELDTDKNKSALQARIVAEKILQALSEPYLLTINLMEKEGLTVEHRCTASIGVTLFLSHESGQEDIVKRADKAMYQAKDAGRNLICFL